MSTIVHNTNKMDRTTDAKSHISSSWSGFAHWTGSVTAHEKPRTTTVCKENPTQKWINADWGIFFATAVSEFFVEVHFSACAATNLLLSAGEPFCQSAVGTQ